MSLYHHHNFGININPPPAPGAQINIGLSPAQLQLLGFNIPVEISTATAYRQPPNPLPLSSILVMAHFDTGASITFIDISLAQHLQLIAMGLQTNFTADGQCEMPTYSIDLRFPNTGLSSHANLRIGSCRLNFNLQQCMANPNNPQNFGVLIGRDIMSRWNIVWNGPTSTVFVSD